MYQTPRSDIFIEQNYRKMDVFSRFKSVFEREPMRFAKRGYGKLFAIFQLYFMLVLIPKSLTLIWPFVLEHFSELQIFTVGIIVANLATLIIYNSIFLVIYRMKIPFFEKYKVFKGDWPWETDYVKWKQQLKKSILNIAINLLIIAPIYTVLTNLKDFYFKFSIEEIPSPFTIAWQVFLFMLGQDLFFYLGHSLLHHPKLYWIHKQHHEYTRTVSIAAEYSHPIEAIFNYTAFGVGYKLLSFYYPVHVYAVIVWTVFRIVETTEGHSGYQWTFSYTSVFPIGGGPEYHDFHHSKNAGNYGSFFIFWDTLFGTNKEYFKWKKQQDNIRKIESQAYSKPKDEFILFNKKE